MALAASQDSTLHAIDAERREPLGRQLKPKTLSTETLCLTPLDAEARPVAPVAQPIKLAWTIPPPVSGPPTPLPTPPTPP